MRWIAAVILLLNVACVSSNYAGGPSGSSDYNFTITFSDQWKRLNTKRYFMLTKDGPFSQYILAQQRHVDKPFRHTNKTLQRGIKPLGTADIVLEEIRSDEAVQDLKVGEVSPAVVAGCPGFKITFDYKLKEGYRFRSIYYGFLRGDWFYSLRFNAKEACFLEKDIADFHRILQTFRILDLSSSK